MKYAWFLSLFLLMALLPNRLHAQLIKSIPAGEIRLFTTDDNGNVYLVKANNELARYNRDGDSTGAFSSVQNGDITWVDATNPLRILVYFQAFSKIILLDRMLTPKNELDLRRLGIFSPPAAGVSADGAIWVYDYVNAKLKKIDDQLNVLLSSNDMRIESQTVPAPRSLIERDYKIYLCDTTQGIYVFDRYGGYINTLELTGADKVQVIGSQIVYRIGDTLHAYDLKSFALKKMPLPSGANGLDLMDARLERGRVYLLYSNRLDIYRRDDE